MKAFIFDVDDTLYDQIQPFSKAYYSLFQKEVNIYKLFIANRKYSDELFKASQLGEISMEEMYIYRAKNSLCDFGIHVTDEEALKFQEIYEKMQGEISTSNTILNLLADCQKNNITLGIITNGPSKHQRKKLTTLGLNTYFPEKNIIVSGDLKVAKPEREIFDYAKKIMELDLQETYFIGDSFPNDIVGAHNAGWKMIWLNRRQNLATREDIKPTYTVQTERELSNLVQNLCHIDLKNDEKLLKQ